MVTSVPPLAGNDSRKHTRVVCLLTDRQFEEVVLVELIQCFPC